MTDPHAFLADWIASHFDEQVAFLQALVRVPTDTPPGRNAEHAEVAARALEGFGWTVDRYPVPADLVAAQGMVSITNLVVRRRFGDGPTIALNAHGDVVPPGDGWAHDPYGGEVENGRLYGRASAVSKSDFATYAFALRALDALAREGGVVPAGTVELHFTYDEEFGGELGPGWLLKMGLVKPDLLIAAGFAYQVVNAHNGCLQLEVTVHGRMAHAAIPASGVDALRGANAVLTALYAENEAYRAVTSAVEGIEHPYVNVGRIEGGTNTNVVPGKVVLRLDRRMIPEEDPASVEARVRQVIEDAAATVPGVTVEIRRLLLARALTPAAGIAAARRGAAAQRRSGARRAGARVRHAALHRRAALRRGRRSGRDLRRGAAHGAGVERQARRRAPRARRPPQGHARGGAHPRRPAQLAPRIPFQRRTTPASRSNRSSTRPAVWSTMSSSVFGFE